MTSRWLRALRAGWITVFLIMSVVGCAEEEDAGTAPAPTGTLSLTASGLSATDVVGVLYDIVCESGFSVSQYVPFEAGVGLPPHVNPDLAGAPFADLFLTMPPGKCTVTATAMADSTTPAEGCKPTTVDVVVKPNQTTEELLIIVCTPPPVGSLDVITVVTDGPGVVTVSYEPSKFITKCKETTITVTTSGPDVTVTYAVVSMPAGGGTYVLTPTATGFTFYAEVPGAYQVTITVSNSGGTSSFTIPIHVMDDPSVEHCDETCCKYPEGNVNFANSDFCKEAGGTLVPEAECRADICCKTPGGAQFIDASACPAGAALPAEKCEQVCCILKTGPALFASADGCDAAGGFVAPDEKCQVEVCCKLAVPTIVPITECPSTQVLPIAQCAPVEVCCQLEDGTLVFSDADKCKSDGGVVQPLDKCLPKVCCVDEDGTASIQPASTCKQTGGVAYEEDQCKKVCCQLPGTPTATVMIGALCAQAGGIPLPKEKCKSQSLTHVWQADYTMDLDAPCEDSPYLVVPSSAANKLAVYDLATLLPLPGTPFDTCGNPSRILMDANTDVYATCRGATNANGVCKHDRFGTVLWCRDFNPECTSFRGIVMSGNGRFFVGCSSVPGIVYELDPATGVTLSQLSITHYIYGMAVDGQRIYITPGWTGGMTAIDLATFTIDYSIDTSIMTTAPSPLPGGYGITVDQTGTVFTTVSNVIQAHDGSDGTVTNMWTVTPPVGATWVGMYGIQAGPDGYVYASDAANKRVIRLDPVAGTWVPWALDGAANWNHGLTLDSASNVYAINNSSSSLTKIPSGGGVAIAFGNGGELVNPYGYSGDMTGMAAGCLAGSVDQWFSSTIDSGNPSTTWNTISWVANTPVGTSVQVYYSTDGGTTWLLATNGQVLGVVAQTFQVKVLLSASAGSAAPSVNNVTIMYTVP